MVLARASQGHPELQQEGLAVRPSACGSCGKEPAEGLQSFRRRVYYAACHQSFSKR